jgi:hypothetical protein
MLRRASRRGTSVDSRRHSYIKRPWPKCVADVAYVCGICVIVLATARTKWRDAMQSRMMQLAEHGEVRSACAIAAMMGHVSAKEAMEEGRNAFRALPVSALCTHDLASNASLPALAAQSKPVPLGACHAFMSHSWVRIRSAIKPLVMHSGCIPAAFRLQLTLGGTPQVDLWLCVCAPHGLARCGDECSYSCSCVVECQAKCDAVPLPSLGAQSDNAEAKMAALTRWAINTPAGLEDATVWLGTSSPQPRPTMPHAPYHLPDDGLHTVVSLCTHSYLRAL